MAMRIDIKPLSANESWQGRKTKTKKYREFERVCLLLLPPNNKQFIPEGDLHIDLVFGVSNLGFDLDNGVKPFLDILQKKYKFNDNRIMSATISKSKTKKGEEWVGFFISPHSDPAVNLGLKRRIINAKVPYDDNQKDD
jgi:Holliday junction resolvase RusA-like endonuclease